MTTEEFQKLVIEKLTGLEERMTKLEERMTAIEDRVTKLEERQSISESKLDGVFNQTANLLEFRAEVNQKLDALAEENKSIHEILGRHDVAIITLKRKIG